jgi:hypothetical protein
MNGMEINDEIISRYVEGNCTKQELTAVREYLVKHPDELDRIICLMDSYRDYVITPEATTNNETRDTDYLDFSLATAAFVPFEPKREIPITKDHSSETLKNLQKILSELDAID